MRYAAPVASLKTMDRRRIAHPGSIAAASLAAALTLGITACSGDIGDPATSDSSSPSGGNGGAGATTGGTGASTATGSGGAGAGTGSTGTAGEGGATTTGTGTGTGTGGSSPADAICARWTADRADLGEGTWSGDVAACNAGDVSAQGRANALKLVNLYRFLAALPPVTTDPVRDQKGQSCALMMHANNQLSHSPPPTWTCYSADGAEAAGQSNISSTPGVAGVDLYMADPGNDTTMGHRRWILSGSLGPIGLGTTNGYSCMGVIGGSGSTNQPFTAWPPPGPFPFGAVNASFATIDQTGWTIQSSSIDLGGAVVTITDAGADKPVAVNPLAGGYGSAYAIRMVPQGWTTEVGHTYSVSVAGVSQPIDYDVEVVACN